MIKFFRKIRRNLLSEGKTGKYFKYAIGEIILVVIGILIALQVNDWNNSKIDATRIQNTLQDIHDEIVIDSIKIIDYLKDAKEEVNHIQRTLERARNKDATLDTLVQIAKYDFNFYWIAHFKYSDDSFESIKSSGFIEKIPEDIKKGLTDFYNAQKYWIKVNHDTNMQYRERFDDFVKTYTIFPASKSSKKTYTYINNINWINVDPKHFNPRISGVIMTRRVLYRMYLNELEDIQTKSREILKIIKPHLK